MRRQITYDPLRDYYEILGVDSSADDNMLREAYRQAVRAVHPDLNPDREDWATDQLQMVNEAYDVLSDHTRRRDYDRARWPHVPVGGRRRTPTETSRPTYDPDRPWWEQANPASTGWRASPSPAASIYRSPRRHRPPADPGWLYLSNYLKQRGWNRVNAFWLTLVGLWRSPYATLLSVLALFLAADVALIIYVAATPTGWDDVQTWVNDSFSPPTAEPLLPVAAQQSAPISTDQLHLTCADPALQITSPEMGDRVGTDFDVYGTLQHTTLWTYRLAIGWVAGETASANTPPDEWTIIRPSPINQSIPEPAVEDALLTTVDLADLPVGLYVIRLEVELRNGDILLPCDIVVHR